jgi:calcineurin-like phosphoesterase
MPKRFNIADGPSQLNAVLLDIGEDGRARDIQRIQIHGD